MRIAVIGAGAMGSIYGSHLSEKNEVYLIDNKKPLIELINQEGIVLKENEQDCCYHPLAIVNSEQIGKVDLVILFVKSLFSREALSQNRCIIGEETYLMTLQNGGGHEDVLLEFVSKDKVIIGTTEDNGAILKPAYIRHGGSGKTNIGMLVEDTSGMLKRIKENFESCGFPTLIHENIHELIWAKLFTNVSLSVLTGILQVNIGYIGNNPHTWLMTQQLIKEAVDVAKGMGLLFREEDLLEAIKKVCVNSPEGYTSIYADLRDGRRTEVDTISGYVVRMAHKCNIPAPTHEFVVELVHAMEQRGC